MVDTQSQEGYLELRKAVAESLNKKYRRDVSPNQVLVTAGGRLALYYAFLSLPENAKVGILSPDWPAYRDICNFL